MEEILKKIIGLAVCAPSGDNMQPWRFEIRQNSVRVFIVPKRDQSLYNYRQQGALLAHGALLENISLAAPVYGLSADIELLPDPQDENHTATVNFSQTTKNEPGLYKFIEKRATNRTQFKDDPLTADQKQYLLENKIAGTELLIADQPQQIKALAYSISQGDRMIFENKIVHDFLFDHIRWTEQEERQKKDGLYLKTMELKPPQVMVFKLVKKWPRMKLLNALGFPKLAVKSNQQLYSHGCGFGAVVIKDFLPQSYLQAGRTLQTLWLKTCELNMGLQPTSGLPLLMRIILEGQQDKYLTKDQVQLISQNYQAVKQQFGLGSDWHIAFMFRFGLAAKPPSGRSSRQTPKIETI